MEERETNNFLKKINFFPHNLNYLRGIPNKVKNKIPILNYKKEDNSLQDNIEKKIN